MADWPSRRSPSVERTQFSSILSRTVYARAMYQSFFVASRGPRACMNFRFSRIARLMVSALRPVRTSSFDRSFTS
jgi:hypothetical protein